MVKPNPGELLNDFHFLITNLSKEDYTGEYLAKIYSQRGNAERHQGEIKAAGKLSLSSSPRPKSHDRQNPVERGTGLAKEELGEVGIANAVRLQVSLLVYMLMHIARDIYHSPPQAEECETEESPQMQEAESRMHILSFREYLLNVGATLTRHSRYVTFLIASSGAEAWERFCTHFEQVRWHAVPDL